MKKQIIFLLVLIAVLSGFLFYNTQETVGINKTVGWVWDLSNVEMWIAVLLALALFVLVLMLAYEFAVYLFKKMSRKKT